MQIGNRQDIAFGLNKTNVAKKLSQSVKNHKIPHNHSLEDTVNCKKYRGAVGDTIETLADDSGRGFKQSMGNLYAIARKMLIGGPLQRQRGNIINSELDKTLVINRHLVENCSK
jgi:hypothetical protein